MSKKNIKSENLSPKQKKSEIKNAPKAKRREPDKAQRRRVAEKKAGKWAFSLGNANLKVALIGLAVIILGYGLMYTGVTEEPAVPDGKWNNIFAVDIAPILLIIGYCVIIPFALMKKFDEKTEN